MLSWGRRQKYGSRHAGEEAAIVIRQRDFDGERFNIALRAADVALGSIVILHTFEKHLPLEHISGWKTDVHGLAEFNVIDVAFLNIRTNPEMGDIHENYDGRALCYDLALLGHA